MSGYASSCIICIPSFMCPVLIPVARAQNNQSNPEFVWIGRDHLRQELLETFADERLTIFHNKLLPLAASF